MKRKDRRAAPRHDPDLISLRGIRAVVDGVAGGGPQQRARFELANGVVLDVIVHRKDDPVGERPQPKIIIPGRMT